MFGLQEMVNEKMLQRRSEVTAEEWENLLDGFENDIPEIVDGISKTMLEELRSSIIPNGLLEMREERRGFEQRLGDFWSKAIDLLEMFIQVAFESGMMFNDKYREDASRSNDFVFEALSRLHAKACQTSHAVLVLLKAGLADDAYARWRSLHEIAVIGLFLRGHDQELSERYLLHEPIQQYKLAFSQMEVQGRNNEERITQQEIDILKSVHDDLVKRFGKKFRQDYGWAEDALKGKHPSFYEIERQVQLDHLRPYYKMASDNVHANSHGIYFRLGLDPYGEKVLLAGPSTAGLADPGHATAISLLQITTSLLTSVTSIDSLVVLEILNRLVNEVGEAFLEIHKKHESEVLANQERLRESDDS